MNTAYTFRFNTQHESEHSTCSRQCSYTVFSLRSNDQTGDGIGVITDS